MLTRQQLEANLAPVRKLIGNRDVTIVAVTKQQPVEIYDLCRQVHLFHVGENRAQEVRDKCSTQNMHALRLHFLAPVQSKNIKYLVGRITSFDALSSLETAQELNLRWAAINEKLAVLLQLNCSGERQKSGLEPLNYAAVLAFARKIETLPALQLQGVMAMGPTPCHNYDRGNSLYERDLRRTFQTAAEVCSRLQADLGRALPRLSLGMSDDYDVALEFGSTELRLGSLLWRQTG